jgi:hypothetical protein
MYNPITKTIRYLRREYPFMSGAVGGMTLLGAAIGVGFGFIPGVGLLIAIPAWGLGMGGIGLLSALPVGEDPRRSSNSGNLNGVKIVGRPRDVDSMLMMQQYITNATKKLQHLPELPKRTQRRIEQHLKDIAPRLARLRVYDGAGAPLGGFSFTREVIDTQGYKTIQPVAAVATPMTGPEAPVLPAPTPALTAPPQQKPLPGPDLSAEFGTLAAQVKTVEKRVDALENPAPVTLDKPKLG